MTTKIYPDYTMILLVFNLLGWWFKGKPFIGWWWFLLIAGIEILFSSLALVIAKKLIKN